MARYHVMCELRVVTEMKQQANGDATESSDEKKWAIVETEGATFTKLAPRDPHPLKTGGNQDGSSNPHRIGALALVFIVYGANAVGLFVMPTNQQTRTAHPRNQTWITSRLPYAGRLGPLANKPPAMKRSFMPLSCATWHNQKTPEPMTPNPSNQFHQPDDHARVGPRTCRPPRAGGSFIHLVHGPHHHTRLNHGDAQTSHHDVSTCPMANH